VAADDGLLIFQFAVVASAFRGRFRARKLRIAHAGHMS